jgi:hypothetical protein
MPWWPKKSEPKQPAMQATPAAANAENNVYLVPLPDGPHPEYNYHIGLDKTDGKLYFCSVSLENYKNSKSNNYTIKMKDIYSTLPVDYIENAPGDVVVCRVDTSYGNINKSHHKFTYRLQRLTSGAIYCERAFSEALKTVEHQVWRHPAPTREFEPQGHAEFDKLAVLFYKPDTTNA